MPTFLSLLPITALIAVMVFICKETIEFLRRRNGDQRKLRALMHLLARECELNLWSIKNLRRILSEVHKFENYKAQIKVEIKRKPSGRAFAIIRSDDGGIEMHVGIPKVHRELMSKFLLEIATLDEKLFEVVEPAYDGLAEVEHLRESLMNVQDAPDDIGEDGYLEGLAGYALDELQEAENSLARLYEHCTGLPLTEHRLR